MPVAQVNGQRIGYDDTGGDRPAVMFAHGLLMTRAMFQAQVEALRGEFRCISWDQRGHGETGPAEADFSYWDSAADGIALARHLGVERAVLVGMSQGGFLSLRAALAEPGFVAGLALIDTQAGLEDPAMVPVYRAMSEAWQANGLDDQTAELIAAMILSPGDPGNPEWIAAWKAIPVDARLGRPLDALLERDDLGGRLGEIACPAIVFHGELDPAIPMERAEQLAAGLPGCEGLIRVAGAGHAANLSHPDQVNGPLLDFCRRHAR